MGCQLTATGVQLCFYKYHCEKKEGFSLMYTHSSVTHFSTIKYYLVLGHQMLLQQVLLKIAVSMRANQSLYYNCGSFCKSQGIAYRDDLLHVNLIGPFSPHSYSYQSRNGHKQNSNCKQRSRYTAISLSH